MHPEAFDIGGITIYWYGIFVAAGVLLGLWTASRRALQAGLSRESIVDLGPWLIGGAVIGARLLYVISYWEQFQGKSFWSLFAIRDGGLVFYGGLIGASAATLFYLWKKKLPVWRVADVLAPSIALGHAFGRIGCLMTGCCYGSACDLPWAIQFPKDHATGGIPVHPTQMYESIANFALYGALVWLFRRRSFDGQVFGVYLVAYAILRSIVELFRGDYPAYSFGGMLTPGQTVSLVIFVLGAALLWRMRQQKT